MGGILAELKIANSKKRVAVFRKGTKQAEAEVVPSSSLVEVEVVVKVGVGVGVEVGVEVRVEVEVGVEVGRVGVGLSQG